jgi:arylsulfatase A-like enzyme
MPAARAAGMLTRAAVPGEVLRFVGEQLISRGFDHVATIHTDWKVQDVGDHVSAGATVDEALTALAEPGARPFVWLHFFDVHEHHQIEVPRALLDAVHDGGSPAMHRYRALLHAIDAEVGRLLDKVGDRAIVVFASDHGEALGEDPRLLDTHGQVAYATLVRIPIALRVPGVAPAQRTDPVSLVDLAPTLLDLMGLTGAMQPLDGIDLVPTLLDAPLALRPPPDRAIVIHEELQWSVVQWPYQLIVRPADNLVELYDLKRDPGERANLAASHAELVSQLRARYAEVPVVRVDRTPSGRSFREQQARPPQSRAPR